MKLLCTKQQVEWTKNKVLRSQRFISVLYLSSFRVRRRLPEVYIHTNSQTLVFFFTVLTKPYMTQVHQTVVRGSGCVSEIRKKVQKFMSGVRVQFATDSLKTWCAFRPNLVVC